MKTVGLIDYYLDQYHAENYPNWIREASGGEIQVKYAWAMMDKPGGKSNIQCCKDLDIELLGSAQEVIDKSDCLIVMSPDDPQMHEELCKLPLTSGKPVYVDKTFAPDRESAMRIIKIGEESKTPFFSTSALRYTKEYNNLKKDGIEAINSRGPGMFENYGIHQLEPIIWLMGVDIDKIMYIGNGSTPAFVLRYADGRTATIAHLGWECDFSIAINYEGDHAVVIQGASDFYNQFIIKLVEFFKDGKEKVPHEETLQVITILEYGKRAMAVPDTWVTLPEYKL